MIFSLFKQVEQANKCAANLALLGKLEQSQSQRAKEQSLALITSPKGLTAIFTVGLARGIISPSITRQLKSLAVVLGKTNLDGWLTGEKMQTPE